MASTAQLDTEISVELDRRRAIHARHQQEALSNPVASQEALIGAVNLGFEDVVRRQVDLGASVNEPTDEGDCLDGMLPVLVAVRNLNTAMLRLLLDLGAHVDGISRGNPRSRPLQVALSKDEYTQTRWQKNANLAIVQLLVERGADCSRIHVHKSRVKILKKAKRRLHWQKVRRAWRLLLLTRRWLYTWVSEGWQYASEIGAGRKRYRDEFEAEA